MRDQKKDSTLGPCGRAGGLLGLLDPFCRKPLRESLVRQCYPAERSVSFEESTGARRMVREVESGSPQTGMQWSHDTGCCGLHLGLEHITWLQHIRMGDCLNVCHQHFVNLAL